MTALREFRPRAAAIDLVTARIPRVMPTDAARAVGRFEPDGPIGYRAATAPAAPLRAARVAAVEDERTWLDV